MGRRAKNGKARGLDPMLLRPWMVKGVSRYSTRDPGEGPRPPQVSSANGMCGRYRPYGGDKA